MARPSESREADVTEVLFHASDTTPRLLLTMHAVLGSNLIGDACTSFPATRQKLAELLYAQVARWPCSLHSDVRDGLH